MSGRNREKWNALKYRGWILNYKISRLSTGTPPNLKCSLLRAYLVRLLLIEMQSELWNLNPQPRSKGITASRPAAASIA